MSNYNEKVCKLSGVVWKQYNSLQKCPCEDCKKQRKKPDLKLKSIHKPIKQVSDKRKVENAKYLVLRIEFLGRPENQKCPITGKPTTDVHHMKGRIGSLLLDTRYWVALSRDGHKYVEENPEWAKAKGYSLNRLTND